MLKTIEVKETYKVIDKKVYAYIKETGAKRLVDPCDTRVEISKEIEIKQQLKRELESKLAATDLELAELIKLDNEIAALGYCKKDRPIYKKIDGITLRDGNNNPVVESYTHDAYCPNKNKGV